MNEVTIKIIGKQHISDGEVDKVEMMTRGKYYEKNNATFLVYDESELSGMEGSTTTLKIDDQTVTMKRFGSNESKLVFEKDVKHKSIYKTMYGNMDIEVSTEKIEIERNEENFKKVNLKYKLKVSQNQIIRNELTVEVI